MTLGVAGLARVSAGPRTESRQPGDTSREICCRGWCHRWLLSLQWLGRTYGATKEERHRRLPGDELTRDPMAVTTHAITICAAPSRIWPWLVQMGWHRGGWYTAGWVDRLLFPANAPSADHIVPELQRLVVGDLIPDGPPGR